MTDDKKANFSIGEVGKEIGITAGGIAIVEVIRKILDLMKMGSKSAFGEMLRHAGGITAEKAAQKVSKKMEDKYRAKLLMFIQKMESSNNSNWRMAAINIRKRQEDRQLGRLRPDWKKYQPGEENLLVDCLGKILMLGEEKETQIFTDEQLFEFFAWLGNLPPKEFDSAIEFLNHDVVKQWFLMLGMHLNEIVGIVGSELRPINEKWAGWINEHRATHGRTVIKYQKETPSYAKNS